MIGLTAEEVARDAKLKRAHTANAKARAFLRFAGLTVKRKPGRLPCDEAKAFARVVSTSELEPRELVDLLLGALLDERPGATISEIANWLAPPGGPWEESKRSAAIGVAIIQGKEVDRDR